MNYPLSLFRTITSDQLSKLEAIGIQNTDALLSRAALPSDRDAITRQSGLGSEEITRLASLSDLVRVKGIGTRFAETLVETGLAGNVQGFLEIMRVAEVNSNQPACELVSRSPIVKDAASALIKEISARSQTTQSPLSLPSKQQLVHAAEEALELKPRLVLQISNHNAEFRQEVQKEWKNVPAQISLIIKLWVGTFSLFIPIAGYVFYQTISVGFDSPIDRIYNDLALNISLYLTLGILTLVILFSFCALLVYGMWLLFMYLLGTKIKLWLFNAKPYQETYQAVQWDLVKRKRSDRFSVIFVGICVISFLYYVFVLKLENLGSIELNEFTQNTTNFFFLIGLFSGVIYTIPSLLRLLSFNRNLIDDTGLKRYIIYIIFSLSTIPIILLLLTQVAIPVSFGIYDLIFDNLIIPDIKSELVEYQQMIETYQADESEDWKKDFYLQRINRFMDKKALEQLLLRSHENNHMLKIGIAKSLNSISGMLFAVVLMVFIFPYLIFGGLGKGIFFILLLSISFSLDNFLQAQSPTWFSSETNPLASATIIAICLLASALFFDWLYDFITSQPKFCPSCDQELSQDDLFCKSCGLVQPYRAAKKGGIFRLLPDGLFIKNRALRPLGKPRR